MTLFLKSLGVMVAMAITNDFEPHGDEDTWSDTIAKDYEANTKAQYALTQALNDDDLSRVINCKTSYEVWNDLLLPMRVPYKSNDQILTCFILNTRTFIYLIMSQ